MKNVHTYFSNLAIWNVKLHNYHWNVVGKQFMPVHTFTEEVYDNVFEQYDTVAELLKMRGKTPLVTVKDYLAHASIEEKPYTKKVSAEDMVASVVHDYRILRDELVEGIELTGEAGDDCTQDMLIGYKTEIDKNIWMLQAFLGQSPLEGE